MAALIEATYGVSKVPADMYNTYALLLLKKTGGYPRQLMC